MTREELQHRTDVQAAYLAGKSIQIRYRNDYGCCWEDIPTPGFDWDYCDYRVKPEQWRAARGGQYYYINEAFEVKEDAEDLCGLDDNRYRAGNYFKTIEEAAAVVEEIEAILTKHRNV